MPRLCSERQTEVVHIPVALLRMAAGPYCPAGKRSQMRRHFQAQVESLDSLAQETLSTYFLWVLIVPAFPARQGPQPGPRPTVLALPSIGPSPE